MPPDLNEPNRVAEAARILQLTHVVITSVTRDDLPDGGASMFADTIRAVRKTLPDASIEVLIPDFQGNSHDLRTVLDAEPQILNHNIETVPSLYETVRKGADYRRSLTLLKRSHEYAETIPLKSGIMLGLGELESEILSVLEDLLSVDCRMLTIGQYLQPSKNHLPVKRYVPPEEFEFWKNTALQMGFLQAACGPFVRSSYHAKEFYRNS